MCFGNNIRILFQVVVAMFFKKIQGELPKYG
ncbi:unnamed protein product [Onchocerca flexuosa]|uniref:Uncharacterized protein n=1 Tax=Onchocerca flexuosa TaxID=387005 RepID=A0A183HXA3_9BILA|nr:unnamed protein product [Onchocerca flexuosa]